MSATSRRPFPKTLVRDLLGLTRLLYRAEQDVDVPEGYGRLGRLEEAGRAFREALETARSRPGAPAAWRSVETGLAILVEVVRSQPELREMVRISAAAVRHR